MMKNFLRRYKNSRIAVQQIRAGEWVPKYNSISREHITAHRGCLELWIGNGSWFCDIERDMYFGLFWRHYVWWAAARKLKRNADKSIDKVPSL